MFVRSTYCDVSIRVKPLFDDGSRECFLFVQMVTVYSPLTWGIYAKPPPDIPECGFVGEFCPPPIHGKSLARVSVR